MSNPVCINRSALKSIDIELEKIVDRVFSIESVESMLNLIILVRSIDQLPKVRSIDPISSASAQLRVGPSRAESLANMGGAKS